MVDSNYKHLKLENQLCFPLYAASREMIKLYRPYLEPLDLTYTQYVAMMVIWEVNIISVKDLGKRLYLDSGTLTPVLKSLESKGFIKRYRSSEDERVLLVELTEAGMQLRERAVNIPIEMAKNVTLDSDERIEFYRLIYKLLDLVKDKY
ncbi:MAG: MarR family transcriptional regulator [Ruminococcus sp.]|nr:MarR family transcriptional regulator [Ruminococcus sp.]